MKTKIFISLFGALCFGFFSCGGGEDPPSAITPKAIIKANHDTKVWAHFMLWYETPESINEWGQHWSKGEPRPVEENGAWKNLYTRYAPITGPYFSRDRGILEYQLLLMKYSGIDGVIANWYGVDDRNSTEDKTRALEALFAICKETGIELAVCYEDRFKRQATNEERIASIKTDMDYLQKNFFTQSIYSKIDEQPLLLIFGPQVEGLATQGLAPTAANWNQCFANLNPKPAFYPLQGKSGSLGGSVGVAKSVFRWSNNSDASGSDNVYLTQQFNVNTATSLNIFVAMPGFNDCYNGVAGVPRYRVTNHNGGAFFKQQLDLAAQYKPKHLQLCTWNDYGEGTIIEPTVPDAAHNNNNSYIYLEQLHEFTGVTTIDKSVLPQIKRFYDLRIANRNNSEANKKLKEIYSYFCTAQPAKAIEGLNKMP